MNLASKLNDSPITAPQDDLFGVDPFAKAIASSIRSLTSPEGTAIAITGPWGSGKSGALNLIQHHLQKDIDDGKIVPIRFDCWWFRGEDALALAFFRELYAGMGPSVGERFRKLLPKLGARLLRAGGVVGAGIDAVGGSGAGRIVAGAMEWAAGLISQEENVESLHRDVSNALQEQQKRFLIFIDDIDRLSPDEALLVFRLIKSVGRLPNVIYLLAFDRILAEKVVSERYPAEGPHYLEKIIQISFDLPSPEPSLLGEQFISQIQAVCGEPPEKEQVRFMNAYHIIIAPELKTPRALIRLLAAISATWSPISGEVDLADFMAIECLRFSMPKLYRAIRENKSLLCGTADAWASTSSDAKKAEVEGALFGAVPDSDKEHVKRVLMHLFPRLKSVWMNTYFGSEWVPKWQQQRLVCTPEHFDTYFRYSVGEGVLPRVEVGALVAHAGEAEFVQSVFRRAKEIKRRNGSSNVPLLLQELTINADRIAQSDIEPLLSKLFSMGDELDLEADRAGAFRTGNNELRVHWLMRRLVLERFTIEDRTKLLSNACEHASLDWFCGFAESVFADYHPDKGLPEPEGACLVTKNAAEEFRIKALKRVRAAADSGELVEHKNLSYFLHMWCRVTDDCGNEVRKWSTSQLSVDHKVIKFVKAFTAYYWSQGGDDLVAKKAPRVAIEGIENVLDKDFFLSRVDELILSGTCSPEEKCSLEEFLNAWRRQTKKTDN